MRTVFIVTIKNWEKHNPNKKKNHRYFLLENRFFEDSKISQLPMNQCLIFVKLMCVAGELMSNPCEIHAGLLPNRWRISDGSLLNALISLQQIQLVSFEKKDSFIIEEKIKTKKTSKQNKITKNFDDSKNEENSDVDNSPKMTEKIDHESLHDPLKNSSHLISFYIEKWKELYNTTANPVITGKIAGSIKTFAFGTKNKPGVGFDKAKEIIQTYLEMKDSFYAMKRHDIPTMLNNLNAISLFKENRRLVTKLDLKELEKETNYEQTLRKIREEGI